ncbi:GNAT family N-acetyltransferase [Pseudochelatococcus sp. G4_1912]|uniref:GNAT family N-acetyltransferase n=1 Tax=Pseudochelatococcus sp. G4_1912 TaxID=3114288 RepID=UPI0039C64466
MVGDSRLGISARIIAETPRLLLTEWNKADVHDYAQLIGDERVMRYIGNGEARNISKAEAEINGFIAHEAEHGFSRWVVREQSHGRFVGMVGFMVRDGEVDFGGRVNRAFWGSGYAPEALVYALKEGLAKRGIGRAIALTVEKNERAWKLNEKFGLKYENTLEISGVKHVKQSIDANKYWGERVFEKGLSILEPITKRDELRKARLHE